MSLRWRIMAAIVFIVVLTVLTSVGVGYYATQARLGVFVEQVGGDEANQLARSLRREYTASGGWATVDRTLAESGYVYDGAPQGGGPKQAKVGIPRRSTRKGYGWSSLTPPGRW